MAPSLPTAQPWRLSAAKRIELIVFPCGKGFCHSQPGSCGCCAEARNAENERHTTLTTAINAARRLRGGRTDRGKIMRLDSVRQRFPGSRVDRRPNYTGNGGRGEKGKREKTGGREIGKRAKVSTRKSKTLYSYSSEASKSSAAIS